MDLSDKPIVAAIHTRAFGGGLETALACQYRVADRRAVFAFPEVGLGVIPGGGGSQRFPRLCGFEAALDIITSARVFGVEEAQKLGLIDKAVDDDLEAAAIAFARETIARNPSPADLPRARNREAAIGAARANPQIFDLARANVRRRYRGFNARLRAIDAIENALTMPFDEAFEAEVEIFENCLRKPEHRALGHMFFAEREARRLPDLPKGVPARKIGQVAVIGGGTMGRGITLAFAEHGFPVRLVEISAEARDRALAYCRQEIEAGLAKGRVSETEARARIAHITGGVGLGDAAGADLVVEAVFEDMDLKKKVFAELDRIAPKGAILASNTSNLDINEIAAATGRPQDVVGMHFFSPANIMKLLEIVRGDKTGSDVLTTALAVAKAINKQSVVARVCDGFIANRAFDTYWREAEFLVEEGASPYDVDKTLYDFGMPMGPFAVADLVGLDVGQLIRKTQRLKLPQGVRISAIEDAIVATGRLGQKSRGGWYSYGANVRSGAPDPEILELIARYRQERGFTPRAIPAEEEIIARCIYAVINEGAEGVRGRHRHPILRHRRGRRLWLWISQPGAVARCNTPTRSAFPPSPPRWSVSTTRRAIGGNPSPAARPGPERPQVRHGLNQHPIRHPGESTWPTSPSSRPPAHPSARPIAVPSTLPTARRLPATRWSTRSRARRSTRPRSTT